MSLHHRVCRPNQRRRGLELAALGLDGGEVIELPGELQLVAPPVVDLERRLQKANVAVESVAEKNGDGALAEYIRGQLGLVAQLERAMILERVSEGKRKRKQLGRHVHGSIPFGYRSAGEGKLEKHDEHASTVQRIFHEARDGSSAGRIARELNRDGIPSARGGQWSPQAVRVMLRTRSTPASATA